METQQAIPVGVARGPGTDALQIAGSVTQLIRAPGKEKDIFDGPKLQHSGVDLRDTEHDKAWRLALHLPLQDALDFPGRDFLQTGEDHRITRWRLRVGSVF